MPALSSRSVKTLLLPEAPKPQRFTNSETLYNPTFKDTITTLRSYLNIDKILNFKAPNIPVEPMQADAIETEKQDCVYRLGHSTVLLKVDGMTILTDPVLGNRASPLDWAGPKRYHALPISVEELPYIDVCLISHDHYDHLDKQTVKQLHHKVGKFLVPMCVGDHLIEWGVEVRKIVEFEWWESITVEKTRFVFAPTQHFSGRSYKQRDTSLWGSWAILGTKSRVYFSGDSGYFGGFKEVGKRYGPFDLTLIETGAYDENWADIHMFPEQSVQAHIDVQGAVMLPIHNATFDLSYHEWNEPLLRAESEAKRRNVDFVCPKIGEKVIVSELNDRKDDERWWRQEANEAKQRR
ncbi:MBL fold metallo-hydrolase [Vibrio maritimus]|uniref:MBL fold metallo-hydrolase n=1 Tax=Vibrio maritimus TaxID=990268 RepID=UPI003736EDDA